MCKKSLLTRAASRGSIALYPQREIYEHVYKPRGGRMTQLPRLSTDHSTGRTHKRRIILKLIKYIYIYIYVSQTHQPPQVIFPGVVPPVAHVVTAGGDRYTSHPITSSGGYCRHFAPSPAPFPSHGGIHGSLRRGCRKGRDRGNAGFARFGSRGGLSPWRKR